MPESVRNQREALLEHVRRYRITVPSVVARLFYSGRTAEQNAKNLIHRTPEGLLKSVRFLGKHVYYHLTGTGVALTGAQSSWATPPDPSHFFDLYAELLFACVSDPPQPKLTEEEFDHYFPGRRHHGLPWRPYYIDEDEHGIRRLGCIIVDRGGNLFPPAEKAIATIEQLGADFLAERRVCLGVVSFQPNRERRARAALRRFEQEGIRIVTRSFPEELRPLLANAARAKRPSAGNGATP